jgi:hypothetical protein
LSLLDQNQKKHGEYATSGIFIAYQFRNHAGSLQILDAAAMQDASVLAKTQSQLAETYQSFFIPDDQMAQVDLDLCFVAEICAV